MRDDIINGERDRRWRRVQAVTGLAFAAFVVVHLANTAIAVAGPAAYDGVQGLLQRLYQHPVIEIALLAVVLPLHIAAGVVRARLRRRHGSGPAPRSLRFHRWAGWFLVAVIYAHAAAVRVPALAFDAAPGFAGVSFSLNWLPAWFYPYYFLLALAGFYHALNGTRLAAARLGAGAHSRRPLRMALAMPLVAIATALSLAAFGGLLFPVADPFANDYARVYLELIDKVLR